jgi:hypothetical protein
MVLCHFAAHDVIATGLAMLDSMLTLFFRTSHLPTTLAKNYSGPCPTFFQALCLTAIQGGTSSYEWAGYGLVRALGGICPDEMDFEEWEVQLIELNTLTTEGSDEEVLAWFDRWLPRCMSLVPRRRRGSFLNGVDRYVIKEGESIRI